MPTTIKDVAREAGVSPSTVSKVLNNWTTISAETVARVNSAITRLNYVPNANAVSFARQTTRNIIFLTFLKHGEAYNNPHMFDIMCGVHSALAQQGYALTLMDISQEANPILRISQVISQKSADGMIIHGAALTKPLAALINERNYPHILIGNPGYGSRLCWVDTNHGLAGQTAAEHLIRCGYTSVAFIGGHKNDFISARREKGFIGGMYELGYRIPDDRIGYTDSGIDESYECALKMLTGPQPPEAIVCENNTIAIGTMKAIYMLQLKVPEEVALLTFDIYPYSHIIEPKPTVIDINVHDMGVQAGEMMLRKLANPSLLVQSYTTLPVIIQGESTKFPDGSV